MQANKGEAGVELSPLRQQHVAVTIIDAAWRFRSEATKNKGEAGVAPSPLQQEHVAVTIIDAAWRFRSEATLNEDCRDPLASLGM
jgi:membrane protein implicated in regulation of membrane protease activity